MRKKSRKKTKKELPDSHQQPAPENVESPASGIAAFSHDITRPEQALEALRESESILRSFFDSSGVMRGIVEVIAEDDLRHIADNAMTAAFIGLTPEAMKNKCSSELGEPRDILRMWIDRYNESRKSRKPVTFEYVDTRGKPEAWLLATVSYLGTPSHGYPRFAYVILDITERKKTEEALREAQDRTSTILEGITDTFYSLDEEWRFTLVNPAAEKAPFGRPAAELLGRVIWDLYPNLVGTRIHRHYLDAAEKFTLKHYEAQSPLNGRWYEVFMQGRKGGVDVYMRDITDRKRVETALRESEARLSLAQQASDAGTWDWDILTGDIVWSPHLYSLFGIDPGLKASFDIWNTVLHPEDRAAAGTRIEKALAQKEALDSVYRIIRPGSELRWINARGQGVYDPGGRPVRMYGICIDITRQRRAEEELRESEERMRFALETSQTGAWDLDMGDHTARRSLDHDRIFGYTELLPVWTYEMFLDHVVPEDRTSVDAKFRHATETQSEWNFECRIRRADGEIRWIWVAGRHRPGGSTILGRMSGIVQDITGRKRSEAALKESEERFRVIAETSPVLLSVSSITDGTILFTNPAYNRAFGFQPGELIGKTAEDRFYDASERNALINILRETGELRDREVRVTRNDGTPFWLSTSLAWIRFGGNEAMLGASVDITGRKQVEEDLRRSRDDLEMRVEERTAELKEALEALRTERRRLFDVLETLPVYVCLLDKDYRMPFANKYFRETFSEPAGRPCYEFLFNRTEPCEVCESYTVMKTRAPHHWFWTGPNGRDYDIYDFPFTDSDGSFKILEMGIDITERKAAEAMLQKANLYNRSLIEASLDPLVTIAPDGTISDVNEATIRVTGFTREELVGTDFSDYFTEPEKAKAGYEKVFRDGEVTDYALEIRHRNGQVTPVLYNATVYHDALGKVIGVFASARDITERKKAEEALQKAYGLLELRVKERTSELVQSNTRLRTEIEERRKAEGTLRETSQYLENLINYANAPILVWDPEFRITLFNHAFEHLTDWTAAEVTGKPLDILLPKGCLAQVMDLIRKTLEGEQWESVEIPIRHKTGGIRTVLWNSASVFGADGKTIVSIIAQGQDITDRKKIESEYRLRASEYAKINEALEEEIRQREIADATLKKTLSLLNASFESTADGIFVVDQQGTITGYNQNFMNMWDIPSALLESGKNEVVMSHVLPQLKDPEGFLASINELRSHTARESFDMIEFKDGKIFERYSKPQRIGDTIVGRVWSFRDITDRKHAEENLVASLQEKEVLLREIHHRVKNNLQLISGLLDMTRMRSSDESTNEILTDMMLKIQTMAQIHTRLYESKQFGKVSLTGQIRDQIAALSNIYSHKGHEISCEIHAEEVFLPVDQAIPCALVVNEILSNAYKHAFKGRKKGTIEISVRQEDSRISITIHDNGIGLPADFDISRSNSLGLKLIRTLISHQLKGSFTLRSENGTEMTMDFPVTPLGM